jgi:hypothetical protein
MVQIAKKKQTRLKPIGRTPKARVKERGDSIGRTVKRPKILRLDAPLPGKPRTKKRPKPKIKGIGSLVGGAAASVLKTATNKSKPKKKFGPITPKRGKPQFMKK